MVKGSTEERYGLDPKFERIITTLTCTRPKFYERVGNEVDPAKLSDPNCAAAIRAARAIVHETGQPPSSMVLILQRLRRWMSEGRVTQEQIEAVLEVFESVDDAGVMDEDALVAELVPVLRHHLEAQAVNVVMEEYGKKSGDWAKATSIFDRAAGLGTEQASTGVVLGSKAFTLLERMRNLVRLPTGVMELDAVLEGGPPRGTLNVVVGSAGGGKSMTLGHITGNALYFGQFVGVATLELSEGDWLARLIANITGVPTNSILNGSMEKARDLLASLAPQLGPCHLRYFTPKATTVADIKRWVTECEQLEGRKMDTLVIDYADKMAPHKTEEMSMYQGMGVVFESLRIWSKEDGRWTWTASQAKRGDRHRKTLDLDDVSDSMEKVRTADLVLTLGLKDNGNSITMYVAKNRHGKAFVNIGPLTTDFATGRIVPPVRGTENDPF